MAQNNCTHRRASLSGAEMYTTLYHRFPNGTALLDSPH
jgi:hypothetical protein